LAIQVSGSPQIHERTEPSTKAIRIHEFGDESVLRYDDVPDPSCGAGEVLVRVRAASVNRGDLSRRAGAGAGASPPQPLIIGWDVVGGDVFTQTQQALAEGGRLVSVGRSSGVSPEVDVGLAARKNQQATVGWRLGEQRTPEEAASASPETVSCVLPTGPVVVAETGGVGCSASAPRRRTPLAPVLLRGPRGTVLDPSAADLAEEYR
jgi:hypothetical protein